uniref:NF-X1-type domain-containing protein n=1 Tax=Romanomermis culicivorax TaxID=13658 RepID=A0A915JJ56_ROMCU
MLNLSDEEEDYLDDEKHTQIDKLISSYQSAVSYEDQSKRKSSNFDLYSNGNSSSDVIDKLRDQFIQQCFCCLICIEHVLKDQAIWSCQSCRSSYHLQCIQRWANENVAKFSLQDQNWEHPSNENSKLSGFKWHCPKCRFEYGFREIPKDYRCFCGKVQNPKLDPWLLPHSCGAVCKRSFACNHQCLMLCHPGQCPPCPKIVESTCFCGKSSPKTNRCYLSAWSCNKPCGKVLGCGLHRCASKCHEGPCNACTETFERKCSCGKKISVRPCVEQTAWSCVTPCGKKLPCGKHTCSAICHAKNCPPCAESNAARSCPCGKMKYDTEVDCLDDLKCCGDTCGKIMDCGIHRCVERCHKGPCGSCSQTRVKRCRCGAKEKEFTCGKEYLCEMKCKEKRDCGKHLCNRKCCPGGPEFRPSPCELICQKSLQCGNHKCAQPCHSGPCYPCTLTQEVKCRCGKTTIKVPCGEERRVKPPKCKQLCDAKPVCKHDRRTPHKCHFGDCPPCKQTCNLKMKCGHQCPVLCHKGLLIDVNKSALKKSSTPWDKPQPKFELVDEPCPPCEFPRPVGCFGGHVIENVPCYRAAAFDCGRPCGLILKCGNHKCSLPCHAAKDQACENCDEKCSLPRFGG